MRITSLQCILAASRCIKPAARGNPSLAGRFIANQPYTLEASGAAEGSQATDIPTASVLSTSIVGLSLAGVYPHTC